MLYNLYYVKQPSMFKMFMCGRLAGTIKNVPSGQLKMCLVFTIQFSRVVSPV